MSTIEPTIEAGYTRVTSELKQADVTVNNVNKMNDVADIIENEKVAQANNESSSIDQVALTSKQLEQVAQQLQDFVGEMNRGLEFSVDKDSGRDVIKVIDKASGDLVKQYPSEEVLGLVSKLSDMIGSFVDAQV
jgi:flagellar protein FlaG